MQLHASFKLHAACTRFVSSLQSVSELYENRRDQPGNAELRCTFAQHQREGLELQLWVQVKPSLISRMVAAGGLTVFIAVSLSNLGDSFF